MNLSSRPVRIQHLTNLYQQSAVTMGVLRLDELHALVSGNKWFKLLPYLQTCATQQKTALLTFGGAWSNHLLATAAACNEAGIRAGAIVRGERPAQLSPTLEDVQRLGMHLFFVSRRAYANKEIPEDVRHYFPEQLSLLVPEGGYGYAGCLGAAGIAQKIGTEWTHVLTAVGTGTTLAGLIHGVAPGTRCMGIPVLRHDRLTEEVQALLPAEKRDAVHLIQGFEEGGYARKTEALIGFMNQWYQQTGIPSDVVYTGKLFLAADRLVRQGFFPAGSRVLLIHSGGLQGNRSLPAGSLIF